MFTSLGGDLDRSRRRELLEQAVALASNDTDLDARTKLVVELTCLTKLGLTLIEMGESDQGARMVESALASARASGDAYALASCLMSLSWQGDPAAESRANECAEAYRRSGNQVGLARAPRRRCEIGLAGESFAFVEREWANELVELARAQKNNDLITRAMVFVALQTEQEGDLGRAVEILQRSVEQMPMGVWRNQFELGRALCQLGEYTRAESVLRDFLREAFKLLKPSRLVPDDDPPWTPYSTAMEQWLFGAQPTARQEQEWAFALALLGLALVAGARKQYPRAARLYGASTHFRKKLRFRIYATEKSLHDKIVPRIESALGANAWNSLRAEGAAMTVEQQTALAMLGERADVVAIRERRGVGRDA